MADSVYLQVSLLQHPSNQPLQRTEWSPPDAGKERGALVWRHCSRMLAQGLLGVVTKEAAPGPGRDGVQPDHHCSSSKQRGFPTKHIASCHLSPQQLPDAPFPGGSRSASAKSPPSTLRSSCRSLPALGSDPDPDPGLARRGLLPAWGLREEGRVVRLTPDCHALGGAWPSAPAGSSFHPLPPLWCLCFHCKVSTQDLPALRDPLSTPPPKLPNCLWFRGGEG